MTSLELVDAKLKSLMPEDIPGLKRLLQAKGKRLRPSLVIAIAKGSAKEVDDTVITAATAIELVHLASLVHDDIIDNGTLRWGVATINSVEGNNMALLAGDYLLAKGCSLAASISAEAAIIMADTIAELCSGQARELKDQFNTKRTASSLNLAIKGKTSSLFVAACRLGGLASGLSPKQIEILAEFAENFGLAYQYLDDAKDFSRHTNTTGKKAMTDVASGNYTLPVILSLEGPNKTRLLMLLKSQGASAEEVLSILQGDGSIDKTISEAATYQQKALEALAKLQNPQLEDELKRFDVRASLA